MSTIPSKDRASLCTFTFADGRRCRTPRQSGHPHYCCFHARKQAHLDAADQLGRDFAFLLSGDYFSACDLAAALGRLFAAVARGDVKPRTAATLVYLALTLLQTIQVAQDEYINAFSTDGWRRLVHNHIQQNQKYLAPSSVPPAPPVTPACSAGFTPSSCSSPATASQPRATPQASAPVEAGLEPGSSSASTSQPVAAPQPPAAPPRSPTATPPVSQSASHIAPHPPAPPTAASSCTSVEAGLQSGCSSASVNEADQAIAPPSCNAGPGPESSSSVSSQDDDQAESDYTLSESFVRRRRWPARRSISS